jgi:hypothetical protein
MRRPKNTHARQRPDFVGVLPVPIAQFFYRKKHQKSIQKPKQLAGGLQ